MATTYEEIAGFLKEEELDFMDLREQGGDGLAVRFLGNESFQTILLEEGGKFIRFFDEPKCFLPVRSAEHKAKVFETLLTIQNETKMMQWGYDPNDGKIRACIELPLDDAKLTKHLFVRILEGLSLIVNQSRARILHVMIVGEDTGSDNEYEQMNAIVDTVMQNQPGENDIPEEI